MFLRVQLRMYDCISSVRVCVVVHARVSIYTPTTGVCAVMREHDVYSICVRVLCVCMCVNACVSVYVYV